MATTKNKNLFYQLYSHSNDVTNSGYVCSSAVDEHDTSFDISGSEGQITDSNGDVLSSIDLSSVHTDNLTQYASETKILQPHTSYVLRGGELGETYKTEYFLVDPHLSKYKYYQNYSNLQFDITYPYHHKNKTIHINTYNTRTSSGSFTKLVQNILNSQKIPVTISIKELDCEHEPNKKHDYIVFQSNVEGYAFTVRNVILTPIIQTDLTYKKIAGEFSDSPFSPAIILSSDIINVLNKFKPQYIDQETPDTYNINCDIYKQLNNIFNDKIDVQQLYDDLQILTTYFLPCFDEAGHLINEELFNQYKEEYPDVYNKYFNNIFKKYNINDIIKILKALYIILIDKRQAIGPYRCLEDLNRLVMEVKYPNGAMRGIVIVPDWSSHDADVEKRVLLVNHIADKVEIAVPVSDEKLKEYLGIEGDLPVHYFKLYEKAVASVNINLLHDENSLYISDYDNSHVYEDGISPSSDQYQKAGFTTKEYVDNDFHREPLYPYIKYKDTHAYLSHKVIGLYDYMKYLDRNNLWLRVGDVYMITGIADDFQSQTKNLLSSVLIYNPNDIPVRIKYMVFS